MPPLNAPQYTPATGIGTISPDKKWKYTQQGWVKNEPVAPPTPPVPTIPQGKSPADNLVNYKSAANQVIQLARDKRAELMLKFMGTVAPPGTMAASDFSSILSGMQRAGERTIEMATKDILPETTGIIQEYESAKAKGYIPESMKYLDYLTTKKEAQVTTTDQEKRDSMWEKYLKELEEKIREGEMDREKAKILLKTLYPDYNENVIYELVPD